MIRQEIDHSDPLQLAQVPPDEREFQSNQLEVKFKRKQKIALFRTGST